MGSFFDDAGATISGLENKAMDAASGIKDSVSGTVTALEGGLADGLSAVEGAVGDIAGGIGGALGGIGGGIGGALGGIGGGIGGALGGIGSALGGITGALGGLAGALGAIGKPETLGLPLPLPNPLFAYASYNYILSLSSISMDSYANPDNTYMKRKLGKVICKSGSGNPDDRISTPWGKFEFYIEDLELQHQIGHENGSNNNLVGKITMKIVEPYSMGMFFNVLQLAAQEQKQVNWRTAPFLLTIDFKGNTETGAISNIPGCSRYIPVKLINCEMKVNEQGAVYTITAQPYNDEALLDYNSKLKGDHAARGASVVEMLQSGPKSLQTVINARLKQVAETNKLEHQDKILILFPQDGAASKDLVAAGSGTGNTDEPTVDVSKSETDVLRQLGITNSTTPDRLVQFTAINPIGKSKMKFDDNHKGDTPVGRDQKVYDNDGKNARRGANTINTKESDMKFSQDTDVTNAINQVIMMSEFVDKTLDPNNLSPEGYRNWWSIHAQTYPLKFSNKSGDVAKVHVYRVMPYKVHTSSAATPAGVKPIGYKNLKKQAVKEYNYIYTGKNVDIIKFNIEFKYNFYNAMPADGISGTQDAKTAPSNSPASAPSLQTQPVGPGKPPETEPGIFSSIVRFVKTMSGTDKLGGGGVETQSSRAGRYFHDSITKGNDMINLNMEIIGDPYYIVQTGTGNYVSKSTEHVNLCADGSINHLNGEVDVMINFRNPVDIDQSTGLYDFGKKGGSPVKQFTGLYRVLLATSKFSKNHFTQTLKLNRRPLYEAKVEGTKDQMYGNKAAKNANDPTNRDSGNANAPSSGPENIAGALGQAAGVLNDLQGALGTATKLAVGATSIVAAASALKKGLGKLF